MSVEQIVNYSGQYGNTYEFRAIATETDVNIANNTSKVTVSLYCRRNRITSGNAYGPTTWYATIGSESEQSGNVYVDTRGSSDWIFLATITSGNITHNADGTKTVNISASHICNFGGWGEAEISMDIVLSQIPRTSIPTYWYGDDSQETPTIVINTEIPIWQQVKVHTNRASNNFTHKWYYKIGDNARVLIAQNITNTYLWSVPTSLANNYPTKTGQIQMILETYNGTTLLGTNTKTLNVYISNEYVPSISAITLSGAINGKYVETIGTVTAQATGSGIYSSTIKEMKVELLKGSTVLQTYINTTDTVSKTFNLTNLDISENTTLTIRVTATDSRNYSATKTSDFTVYHYVAPQISNITAFRSNSSGGQDDEGTYLSLKWTFNWTNIANITSLTNQYRYRQERRFME